jgi:4-aminobutyrate aminotransferase
MIGIELSDPKTGEVSGEAVGKVLDYALEEGVLFYLCGNEGEVIRMIPPLTVTKEQIDDGLQMLEKAIQKYLAE